MSGEDIVERLRRDGNLNPDCVVDAHDLFYLTEAADEIERLRAWVRCPEHGPYCGDASCCCVDKHQDQLAVPPG